MPWYSKSAVRLHTGYRMMRASMLRCIAVPAIQGSGYSQARAHRPKMRFMTWRIGMGRTAPSRFVVRKSQKTFGQKKPSKDAAIWSNKNLSAFSQETLDMEACSQAAAVRMIRRAQWFLMSFPMRCVRLRRSEPLKTRNLTDKKIV